jgi:hypothetical protein
MTHHTHLWETNDHTQHCGPMTHHTHSRETNDHTDRVIQEGSTEFLHSRSQCSTKQCMLHVRMITRPIYLCHLGLETTVAIFKQLICLIQNQPLHTKERTGFSKAKFSFHNSKEKWVILSKLRSLLVYIENCCNSVQTTCSYLCK